MRDKILRYCTYEVVGTFRTLQNENIIVRILVKAKRLLFVHGIIFACFGRKATYEKFLKDELARLNRENAELENKIREME